MDVRIYICTMALCAAIGCSTFILAACDEPRPAATAEAKAIAPPQVSVVTVRPSPLAYVRELPGRVNAMRVAEIRARVPGIVAERPFRQGTEVKAGDVLYQLDPAPLKVELEAAEAALAKAVAVLDQADLQAKRTQNLYSHNVMSQAQHETSVATWRQAQADVAARNVDVARAKLNLDYTTVRSPIDGRIGGAPGNRGRVGWPGRGNAPCHGSATRSDLRRLYAVDHRAAAAATGPGECALDRVAPEAAKVKLIFGDGSVYSLPGKLLFSNTSVDPSTGQVTLRGEFPNPKNELLPGMYVRVRIVQATDDDALAVPQQSVQLDDSGAAQVYVVGSNNKVTARMVRVGHLIDQQQIILGGIKRGSRVSPKASRNSRKANG